MPKVNVKRVFLSLLVICMSSASAVADRPPIHWLSGGHTWVMNAGAIIDQGAPRKRRFLAVQN